MSVAALWFTFSEFNQTKIGVFKVSQSYETILLDRRDRVAVITINRPEKRNALNIQTRAEGAAVLEELRTDDSVRVVIITGAGDKAFIAGADIAEFAERTAISQREIMLERGLFNAVDTFPKPIIAMVNGYCLGGGCEVALACDIRIASEKASFGQPEINLGIIPGGGGTQRLTRLLGEGKAMVAISDRRNYRCPDCIQSGSGESCDRGINSRQRRWRLPTAWLTRVRLL